RVGLDVEPRALELAQKNDPRGQFILADLLAEAAPLPAEIEGNASVVVCSEVLEHLPSPERAVALARRLVRPAGRLVVTVPGGGMTPFDRAIGHQKHYTPASLAKLLEAGGFRPRRIYRWGFPFHSLFRLAMLVAPGAAQLYRDDRLSAPARVAWEL